MSLSEAIRRPTDASMREFEADCYRVAREPWPNSRTKEEDPPTLDSLIGAKIGKTGNTAHDANGKFVKGLGRTNLATIRARQDEIYARLAGRYDFVDDTDQAVSTTANRDESLAATIPTQRIDEGILRGNPPPFIYPYNIPGRDDRLFHDEQTEFAKKTRKLRAAVKGAAKLLKYKIIGRNHDAAEVIPEPHELAVSVVQQADVFDSPNFSLDGQTIWGRAKNRAQELYLKAGALFGTTLYQAGSMMPRPQQRWELGETSERFEARLKKYGLIRVMSFVAVVAAARYAPELLQDFTLNKSGAAEAGSRIGSLQTIQEFDASIGTGEPSNDPSGDVSLEIEAPQPQPNPNFNIPHDSGGIKLLERLGLSAIEADTQWRGIQDELIEKFPTAFYREPGHPDVRIAAPGQLPLDVQEHIMGKVKL